MNFLIFFLFFQKLSVLETILGNLYGLNFVFFIIFFQNFSLVTVLHINVDFRNGAVENDAHRINFSIKKLKYQQHIILMLIFLQALAFFITQSSKNCIKIGNCGKMSVSAEKWFH